MNRINPAVIDELAILAGRAARTEIVFILDDVPDIDVLRAGMGADKEVILLDADGDGLRQIAEALEGRAGIDALHIVSHGGAGRIALGTTTLDAYRLDVHDALLRTIGGSLADGADILLYGCDAGAGSAGLALVQGLAGATGADVAASADPTGHAALGADWDLEIRSGDIETGAAVDPALATLYQQVLAIPSAVVHFGNDGNFVDRGGNQGPQNDVVYRVNGQAGYVLRIDGATRNVASYEYSDYMVVDSMNGSTGETALTFSFDTGQLFTPTSLKITNYQYQQGPQQLVFRGYDAKGVQVGADQTISTLGNNVSYVTANFSGLTNIATLRLTADPASNGGRLIYLAFDDFQMTNIRPGEPMVAAVSSTNADGPYGVGAAVLVTVRFDQAVNVAGGQPTLQLETGATDRLAVYESGSGTDTLTFRYVVQPGDASTDLNYFSTGSLSANGATIRAVSDGIDASLVLPALNTANSLGGGKAIVIDTLAPTVAITSNSANLSAGQTATITFTFSEQVSGFDSNDIIVGGGKLGALSGSGTSYSAVFTPTENTNAGTATITVGAGSYTDLAGNAGNAGASPALGYDTLAPDNTATGLSFSSDTGVAGDFITSSPNQTISGSLSAPLAAGERLEISTNGGANFTTIALAAGATDWTFDTTLAGSGTLQLRVVDAAGNSGPVVSRAYVLDTSAPDTPGAPDLLATSDTGASDSDNITGDTTPTFSGTAEQNAAVTLYADGKAVGSGTAGGDGKWSITVDTPLAGATYDFTVKATDLAGNQSGASAPLGVTIVTDSPSTVSSTFALGQDSNIDGDLVTNVAAQRLEGKLSSALAAGEQVEVWTGNAWLVAEAGSGSDSWSFDTTLAQGAQDIKVRVVNAIGNAGEDKAYTVTLDTTAPTLAISGNVQGLKIGETATITFTFSEDPGASFAWDGKAGDITIGGGALSAISGSGLTRSATFTPTAGIDDGKATIAVGNATFIDLAGNLNAAPSTFALAYDTLAPSVAPSIPALNAASDTGVAGDGRTTVTTPVFEGSAGANARVVLYDGATQLGIATANETGVWSFSATLAIGSHSITAVELDAAGNASPPSQVFALTIESATNPPQPQPDPVIDGVTVRVGTVTLPGGVAGTSVAVPLITSGRNETSGQPGLADIPLQSGGGQTTLLAQLPVGYGLTSSGASVGTAGGLEFLIAAIRAATPGHAPADQGHLVGNGTSFLEGLAYSSLLVSTIRPVSSAGADGNLILTGSPASADGRTALVIETAGLAAGSGLDLVDVDFAAIVGAANVTSRGAGAVLSGDGASQRLTVGAGDNASVFAGGGNDALVFGAPSDAGSAQGRASALALPAGGVTTLHGGLALDTAVFAGARADFDVAFFNGYALVNSKAAPDAQALVVNVEQLQFSDGTVAVENGAALTTLAGMYQTVLGRQADLAGIEFWADHRDDGVSWGTIAVEMIDSAERLQSQAGFNGDAAHDIGLLYQALFERSADASGLAYWQGQMADGASLEQVAAGLVGSAEMVGHQRAVLDWDFTV